MSAIRAIEQTESRFNDDFLRGQLDCKNGIEHKPGMGEAYDRGYSAQYQLEQSLSWLSGGGDEH